MGLRFLEQIFCFAVFTEYSSVMNPASSQIIYYVAELFNKYIAQ